jgi:hypothetical protein
VTVRAFSTFFLFGFFILLVADSFVLGRRIKRTVAERFPKEKSARGVVWYGVSRATMVRRWRFPKPAVKVGAQI